MFITESTDAVATSDRNSFLGYIYCTSEPSFSGNRVWQWSRWKLQEPVHETSRKCMSRASVISQICAVPSFSRSQLWFVLKSPICLFSGHGDLCWRAQKNHEQSCRETYVCFNDPVQLIIIKADFVLLNCVLIFKELTLRQTASPSIHVAPLSTSWMYPHVNTFSIMLISKVVLWWLLVLSYTLIMSSSEVIAQDHCRCL